MPVWQRSHRLEGFLGEGNGLSFFTLVRRHLVPIQNIVTKWATATKPLAQRIHGTGIFTYIYHKNQPNLGKYTTHGSYELWHSIESWLVHRGWGVDLRYRSTFLPSPGKPSPLRACQGSCRSVWPHKGLRDRWSWTWRSDSNDGGQVITECLLQKLIFLLMGFELTWSLWAAAHVKSNQLILRLFWHPSSKSSDLKQPDLTWQFLPHTPLFETSINMQSLV